MMPGQALLRLMWRPATLLMLAMLAMFGVATPLTVLSFVAEDPLAVLFTDMPAARAALARLAITFPLAVGLFVGIYRAELEGLVVGRAMPDRGQLVSGTLIFATLAGSGVYVLVSRALPFAQSTAFAALALAWFTLPLVLFRPMRGVLRWLVVLVVAALVIAPAPLISAVDAAPIVVAMSGATLFAAAQFLLRALRIDMRPGEVVSPGLERFILPRGRTRDRLWDMPLAGAGPLGWVQAAAYESGLNLPVTHIFAAAWAALPVYALQMNFLIPIGLASFLGTGGTKLQGGLLHPLSRAERARVAFRGAVLDAVLVYAAAAAIMFMLAAANVPSFGWFAEEMKPISAVALLGFGFALAPLAQFQGICRRARGLPTEPMDVAYFASFIAYVAGTMVAAGFATRTGLVERPVVLAGTIALMAVTIYSIHRYLLREFFATSDLARAD
jgi:hypothetical protein